MRARRPNNESPPEASWRGATGAVLLVCVQAAPKPTSNTTQNLEPGVEDPEVFERFEAMKVLDTAAAGLWRRLLSAGSGQK